MKHDPIASDKVRTTQCDANVNKPRCAVRLPAAETGSEPLEQYLREHNLSDASRFLPKDDDDLDAEVRDGQFDLVLFSDLETLLCATWKGEIRIDCWIETDVRIELATPPATSDWRNLVPIIAVSFERWRKRQRRRQIIASLILSTIALLAMAVLFLLIPPME